MTSDVYEGLWGAEITPLKQVKGGDVAEESEMPACWRNTYGLPED